MPRARVDIGAAGLVTFDRQFFIDEVFDYAPGEHVTILDPSGGGKTQFAYQLLGGTATAECPAVVFVMKARDKTVTKFSRQFKFKTVRDWPPSKLRIAYEKTAGWVLWPTESDNPEADDIKHERIFRRAIRTLYRDKGGNIIFADETYSLENELGLKDDLNRIWTKGRSMETGLWAASQRPAWISMWAYQAHHVFLGNDPDKKARDRFAEIGSGFDPDLIKEITSRLKRYQFLYINRDERTMCIVDA
jgi:hypothetical protein